MFWFIPLIIGAAAAAGTGTSIANQAMDGALFAPEINTYKSEIKADSSANDSLISSINSEANRYTSEVNSFNQLMETTNNLRKSFLVVEGKATELTLQQFTDAIPGFEQQSPLAISKSYEVLASGVGVVGGLHLLNGMGQAAAGTSLGMQLGKVTSEKLAMLSGYGKVASTRAMAAANTLTAISKVKPIATPVLATGSKVLSVGLKAGQGVAATLRAGSAALGPLAAIGSLALIGLDVAYSKERAKQLQDERDRLRSHNNELRKIQTDNQRLMARFHEDRTAISEDELQSFHYMAKVTLMIFGANLPADFPVEINDRQKIDAIRHLNPEFVSRLKNFIDQHSQQFIEGRNEQQVMMMSYWKQILISCQISPRQLVEADPVIGLMGLEFADYIARTEFIGDKLLDTISDEECQPFRQTPPINGWMVQASDLVDSRIYHQADGFWTFIDAAQKVHSYRESHRDEWSVYLVHRNDARRRLQLDLWRGELIDDSQGIERRTLSNVRAAYQFAAFGYEPVTPAPFEYDVDRPGSDYRQTTGANFMECSKVCASDLLCRSFTWTPTQQRCYLKDAIPGPVSRPNTSLRSGYKI